MKMCKTILTSTEPESLQKSSNVAMLPFAGNEGTKSDIKYFKKLRSISSNEMCKREFVRGVGGRCC